MSKSIQKKFRIGELSEKMGFIRRQVKALYRSLFIPEIEQKIKGRRGSLIDLRNELDRLRKKEARAFKKGKIKKKVSKRIFTFPPGFFLKDGSRQSLFDRATKLAKQKGVKLKKGLFSEGASRDYFIDKIKELEKKITIRVKKRKPKIRVKLKTEVHKINEAESMDRIFIKKLIRASNFKDNVRVLYFLGGRLIRERTYPEIFGKSFNKAIFDDWLIDAEYDTNAVSVFEEDFGRDQQIILQRGSDITPREIKQKYLDGVNHCCFQPVIDWAKNKLEESESPRSEGRYKKIIKIANEYTKKYSNGASIDNLQEFCKETGVNFEINDLFSKANSLYSCKKGNNNIKIGCRKKPLKIFKFINSRVNHIDILTQYKEADILTQEDIDKKYKECIDNNIPITYHRYSDKITYLSTINDNYRVFQEETDIIKEFYKDTGLDRFKIKYTNPASSLVRACYHQSGNINFESIHELPHINGKITNKAQENLLYKRIDQSKAYASFYKCSYYQEFPTLLTEFRFLSIPTSERQRIFLKEHVGFYKLTIISFGTKGDKREKIFKKLYKRSICLTSPEIIFLLDNGVILDLDYGAWGHKTIDFRFPDHMIKSKTYHKLVGMWGALYTTSTVYMEGDYKWAEHIKSLGYNVYFYKAINNLRDSIRITFDKRKDKITHMNNFASYICSYQRIQLIQQVLKIDYNDIFKIITDEVVVRVTPLNPTKQNPPKEKILMDGFREKNSEKPISITENENFLSYSVENLNNPDFDTFKNLVMTNKRIHVHVGQGGSGKTHVNNIDKGYLNYLYVCPPHKLRQEKQDEYKGLRTEVLYNIINTPKAEEYIKNPPSVICIDEITCISKEQFGTVCELYPFSLILVCGDLDKDGYFYQLPNFIGKKFKLTKKMHIIEHKHNYRVKCHKLREIINWYRDNVKKLYLADFLKIIKSRLSDREIKRKDVKKKYKINDYVLTGKKESVKEWTKILSKEINKGKKKGLKQYKYLVVKKCKDYYTGTIVISDKEKVVKKGKKKKEKKKEKENGKKKEKKKEILEERHAFTCHQIQGTTIKKDKIFIDIDNLFQVKQMLYVALSRAEYLDQIYLINGNTTNSDSKAEEDIFEAEDDELTIGMMDYLEL